jgi:hypothetical protein
MDPIQKPGVYSQCCIFVFLPSVFPKLPVSMDFPFLIARSLFSTIYLRQT